MTQQLGRVIVGQNEVLKQVLIALFCQGHCILEGVPGLAKTLMISSIAQLLSLSFKRIQFTPDLMPSDITGTEILEEEEGTGRRRMRFVKGPIFGNIILGDEINRTPPKTQAALLQAMQEFKVTTAGHRFPAGEAVSRAGHAEPDRAGRHLSAARGPARPLHVQGADRLSQLRRRADHRRIDDGRRAAEDRGGAGPRRHPRHPADGAQGADRPLGDGLRRPAGAGHAARHARRRRTS